MRQLAGAAIWALILSLGGLIVGIWALVGIVSSSGGAWFEPVIIIVGLIGLALTASAFPVVTRRGLPWLLLGGGTVVLIIGFIITTVAT